jgi:hypothetical protein
MGKIKLFEEKVNVGRSWEGTLSKETTRKVGLMNKTEFEMKVYFVS